MELSIYLVIAMICGITLIIFAIFGFGDIGDVDLGFDFDASPDVGVDVGHFEPGYGDAAAGLSPLSLPIVLSFGTCFGAFGTAFTAMEWNPVMVPMVSALLSFGVSAILFLIMVKIFVQTQANTQISYSSLVGKTAQVTIPIKPGTQGQIMVLTEERGRTLLAASSEEEIKTDSIVTIHEIAGGTAVVRIKRKGLVE